MTVNRFASAQALALRLIAKNGERATLQVRSDGIPADPAIPWEPGTPAVQTQVVDAVFLNIKESRIGGTLIQAGDQKVLIPASGLIVIPVANSSRIIRVDDSSWEIVEVLPLQPNEDRILYTLVARQ